MESQELTHITALSTQSDSAVEALLDAAFGPDRIKRTAYKIRTGMMPIGALSFAALDGQHNFIWLLQSWPVALVRSEEPTSELQSLMTTSYDVFCLKEKKTKQ